MAKKQYWLMKSEPDSFSIDDLAKVKQEPWTGVRNYQARNFMRDDMQIGDAVLFYHSNATPTGIAGIGRIASTPYPDETQFDPESHYYDPGSTREQPRWMLVDVSFESKFKHFVSLPEMKAQRELFTDEFVVLRKGNRLSVAPVCEQDYKTVMQLSKGSR